jgi:hypothetical protein
LLLKGAWRPAWRTRYARAFAALAAAYFAQVAWEPRAALDARTAALLPGLMLARVDGKSPVEYLTEAGARDDARTFARSLLRAPAPSLDEVAAAWLARGRSDA